MKKGKEFNYICIWHKAKNLIRVTCSSEKVNLAFFLFSVELNACIKKKGEFYM